MTGPRVALLPASAFATEGKNAKFALPGITLHRPFNVSNGSDANVDRCNLTVDEQTRAAGLIFNAGNKEDTDDTAAVQPHWFRGIARPEAVMLIEDQGRKVVVMQG